MVAFLPVPTVHRGLMPLKRPSASMGSIGRGPLQCLGGFGKQLSAPSNLCSRPTGVPASSLSMSLIDPGLIAASVGIGAVLWLLVESYESCPVGHVPGKVMESIQVRDSNVEGAGLGLFALKDLESGTILGSYPGRKWPQQLWLNRKSGGDKDAQAKARTYVWLLDDGTVVDPTNADGDLEEFAPWLLPGALRLPVATVPTILSRINEPPKGRDTNVCADYVDGEVIFSLERAVSAGEEFYLDYGPMYERSGYGGGSGSLGTGVYPSDS